LKNNSVKKRYQKIFKAYNQLEKKEHIKKLIELDSYYPLDCTYFCIVDTANQSYQYISKNFSICTGLDSKKMQSGGVEYYVSNFHPNDVELWLKALRELMEFTMTKLHSKKERNKMNYTWNYRVKNGNGKYINVIQNTTPLQFDEMGKPIIGLSHYTILDSTIKMDVCASAKYLNDNNEYETLFFKNYTSQNLLDIVSTREYDIIRLLLLKNSSKEIAEKLFISPHTVNTHRRNILKKFNYTSTGELITYFKNNPRLL